MITTGRVWAVGAVAGLLGLAVGCSAAGALRWRPQPPIPSSADDEPEAVPLQFDSDDAPLAVRLSGAWVTTPPLRAPKWAGTITDVLCPERLRNGDAFIRVDDTWRLTISSPSPFFRSIGPGATGSDVEMLRGVLNELGFNVALTGTRYTDELGRAIKELATMLGAPSTRIFEASWFIWLPAADQLVGSCKTSPGDDAQASMALTSGTTELTAVHLSSIDASQQPQSERYQLTLDDGHTFSVTGPDLAIAEQSALQTLAPMLSNATQTGDSPAQSPTGNSADLASPSQLTGTVRLAVPDTIAVVPASAVVIDGQTTCILIGTTDSYQPVGVEIVGSRLGTVGVTISDERWGEHTTVVRNASVIDASPDCTVP